MVKYAVLWMPERCIIGYPAECLIGEQVPGVIEKEIAAVLFFVTKVIAVFCQDLNNCLTADLQVVFLKMSFVFLRFLC